MSDFLFLYVPMFEKRYIHIYYLYRISPFALILQVFLSPHHNSNNSHNNSYKKYDMYTQTTSHIILDTTNNNNIFPCVRVYVYLYVYVSSFVHQCATYQKIFCYDIIPKLDTKVQISDSIFSFVSTPNNSFLYWNIFLNSFLVLFYNLNKEKPTKSFSFNTKFVWFNACYNKSIFSYQIIPQTKTQDICYFYFFTMETINKWIEMGAQIN